MVASLGLGCSGGSAGPAGANVDEVHTGAPDLRQLRQLLAGASQHAFTTDEQARGCPAGETVGQYLAMLDQNTEPDESEPGRVVERTGGCDVAAEDAMWPAPDPALWRCTVRAHTVDEAGESPWTYELRVRVRHADGSLDLGWLACPGQS